MDSARSDSRALWHDRPVRPRRAPDPRRAAAALGALIAVACGGDGPTGASTGGTSSGGATSSGAATGEASGVGDTTLAVASTEGSGSSSDDAADSTGADVPMCDEIALSLVIDREAPLLADDVDALATFLDGLAADTGATVRVLPNAGVEDNPMAPCTDGADAPGGGLSIAWASGDAVEPGAHDALACVVDIAQALPAEPEPDGDWMMSGLMFPLLQHDDWPPPGTDLAIAMLLAETDDAQHNMYARAGMTAEAFVRLAAGGDRRRAVGFAIGEAGDDVHMLTRALGPAGGYADWSAAPLGETLDAFRPAAVAACAAHDDRPGPDVPGGCERIDFLFVIDGSASMAQEQAALRGEGGQAPVFAEFTDALLVAIDGLLDLRVGVISAEPGDTALHTHHDQPAEPVSQFTSCGIVGSPWLVAPSPEFAERFACLASTRATSIDETPVRNAVLALEDPKNAGFVRDDALLVVVLLTDEDTQDEDTPMIELHDRLLAAVDGDPARLVVLAIAGDPGVFEAPKTTCFGPYGAAVPGRRIHSILSGLGERGAFHDLCAGDLATTFAAILDEVVDTCADYHPEG